jgi:zinc protease
MKKNTFALLSLLLVAGTAIAKESFLDSVKRTKWKDLDVVWVEDDKFPRFTASFYFQDGGLNDSIPGLTQATFDLLTAGTSKESQREIAEFFDFYGANLRHSVTHEYSVYSVQGLTKDIGPVMGKVCELFKDAQFPKKELISHVSRAKSGLKNLVTSHSSLADRIFRNKSLEGTPYSLPVEGSLASFDKLTQNLLKDRLTQLNHRKKVLYLSGPAEVKEMEIVLSNCNWKNETRVSPVVLTKPAAQSSIYLIPVPGANQAQIRIGRYVTSEEVTGKHDALGFLAGFLGGGFTSKLVQELRVKRGLTYSAGAYASMQKDYGRAGIVTFSKNETAAETIFIIRDIFAEVGNGKITADEFKHQQGHQIGGFAFGFEETSAFLGQIMLYDHQNRDLKELVEYPARIARMTQTDLARTDAEVFPWERQTIVVVGDKSLAKSLGRIRPVKILNYQDFL